MGILQSKAVRQQAASLLWGVNCLLGACGGKFAIPTWNEIPGEVDYVLAEIERSQDLWRYLRRTDPQLKERILNGAELVSAGRFDDAWLCLEPAHARLNILAGADLPVPSTENLDQIAGQLRALGLTIPPTPPLTPEQYR